MIKISIVDSIEESISKSNLSSYGSKIQNWKRFRWRWVQFEFWWRVFDVSEFDFDSFWCWYGSVLNWEQKRERRTMSDGLKLNDQEQLTNVWRTDENCLIFSVWSVNWVEKIMFGVCRQLKSKSQFHKKSNSTSMG